MSLRTMNHVLIVDERTLQSARARICVLCAAALSAC